MTSVEEASVLAARLVAETGGLLPVGELLDQLVDHDVPIELAAAGVRLAVRDARLEHASDEEERPSLQLREEAVA